VDEAEPRTLSSAAFRNAS